MSRIASRRTLLLATGFILPFVVATTGARAVAQQQTPTLALLDFTGSGVGRNAADFAALGAAIPHHLGFVLASNPNIRLVDRNRINEIIREQDLGAAGRLDAAAMVRIGRLLGAQYIVAGSFIIQDNGEMAINATSTNMETSQIGNPVRIRGRIARVLDLLDSLGTSLNTSLKLPAMPASARPPAPAPANLDHNRMILLEGAALKAEDRGDKVAAIELWKQVRDMNPSYEGAKVKLAKLGG